MIVTCVTFSILVKVKKVTVLAKSSDTIAGQVDDGLLPPWEALKGI